ncbi:hypothetical protein K492DRAFT_240819 [Lichtheimia hyalospora FSU 10163]|nr:hypothetical protein K492DRAFT_240819 [Lichtheimia hyalospora FSU 10163]
MSDPEESTPAERTPSDTPTQQMNSSSVIRYSRETLLSLHDSPLVAKPPDMPPLSTWFSDDHDAYISKNILNGSPASTRLSGVNNTIDKNVLLAPNKSIFSSASYDKRQEDGLNNGRGLTTSRYRPMNDDGRTRDHNMSNNKDRLLRTGERNFMRGDKNDRRSTHNNNNHPMSSNNNRKHHHSHQQQHHQQHDRVNGNDNLSRLRKDNRPTRGAIASDNTTTSTTTRGSSPSERIPEWMDYSPANTSMNKQDIPIAPRPESGLDLEAWKQDMKQREEQDAGNETVLQSNPSASATASSDLEMLLGVGSLSLQQQQQQQLKPTNGGSPSMSSNGSPMDILSASIFDTNTASPLLSTGRRERGSRFAKFFARREETAAASTPVQQSEPQARSISVDDLFGGGNRGVSNGLGGIAIGNAAQPSASDSPGNVRMLSEEEVLRTLGAKRGTPDELHNHTPSPQQQSSSADALGFDKVLQILSQPKPAAPGQQSPATTVASIVDSESNKESLSELKPNMGSDSNGDQSATASPSLSSTDKAPSQQRDDNPSESTSQQAPAAAKPKLMNSRFAGNLPTSVLRQMSARSSEGRSPSIASNKSGTARSSLGASSPALSNRSPALPKNTLPESSPNAGHHSPNGIAYAQAAPGFHHHHPHRMPPSPAYPFSAGSPVGASAAAHHPHAPPPPMSGMPGGNMRQQQPPRSDPALEQLFQYDNAAGSRGASGPMNPMIPPQLSYAQQQGMDHQFIPPPQHHMMQHPMPPHHMPPNPMLPPHHLPPHLQGQLPPHHQFMQRDMMTPPTGALGNMPPPHMMANGNAGLPPHLFTKSPGGGGGWDRH